jgi:hypothetical protein
MTPDIDDQLRAQLQSAASAAPLDLGTDHGEVLARGRRVVVRRRVLTTAGAAAAALVIAGTIGVLAPRPGDGDALPALPTPTTTPTPEVIPTITPSAAATAIPVPTPTAVATATPTATGKPDPSRTPTSTPTPNPSRTPSATPTPGAAWSEPVTVNGVAYSARLVSDTKVTTYPAYKAEVRANGALAYTRNDANGEHSLVVRSQPRVVFASFVGPIADVVSENEQPVDGESFRSITLRFPSRGVDVPKGTMTITIINLPKPATVDDNGNVTGMVVKLKDGTEQAYCVGYCLPK